MEDKTTSKIKNSANHAFSKPKGEKMGEGGKWRILLIVLFVIALIIFAIVTRYDYSKTPTNTIPIFERIDKWTGKVSVTNYVSKKWKAVQAQQMPAVPPEEITGAEESQPKPARPAKPTTAK